MRNTTEYLTPKLLLELSFQDLLEQLNSYGPMISWAREEKQIEVADLLRQECVFIVGEPGQGKSRLLTELVALAQNNGFGASIVRLNKLGRDQFIEDALMTSAERVNYDITAKNKMLVCLDALDEVASNKFSDIVLQIKEYIAQHPEHTLVITSRLHFFKKYQEGLANINAKYALLMPLDRNAQKKMMNQYGLTEIQVNEAFIKLKQQDKESVLQTPRYLEYFAEWYAKDGAGKSLLSRSTIFNHFVDQALSEEDRKVDKRIAALRRRTLEKLALIMEIAQTNAISHDEMTTFIEDYRSESKLLLINATSDLDEIYNHGLLKDDGEKIAFDNAELQEYLAASAINRMEDPCRAIFQLAINKSQRSINPSWYSTLSFLLEMQPGMLTNIINLEKATPENPERPQDPETHKLISGVSTELISTQVREAIFMQVLGYYLENDIPIKYEVSTRLAFYSTSATDAYLKKVVADWEKSKSYTRLVIIAHVIGSLNYVDRLNDSDYWKEKLRAWALIDEDNRIAEVLKRYAMHALEYFKDEQLILDLKPLHTHKDDLVRRAYEGMCDGINPNHPHSIDTFIKGIKHDSIESRMYLLNITSSNGLHRLLEAIATDKEFLHDLVVHDSIIRKEDGTFFSNLEDKLDADLLIKCKQIVLKVFEIEHGYYAEHSNFIERMIGFIAQHDPNYFSELIKWAVEDEQLHRIFALQNGLSKIMREKDVAQLNELINNSLENRSHLLRIATILDSPTSSNPDAEKIVSKLRNLQPEQFKTYDSFILKMSLRGQRDRTQEEFDGMMQQIKEHSHIPALNRALELYNNQTDNDRFGQNIDRYLWSYCKTIILDQLDPATATLTIHTKDSDGSRKYTISNYIFAYGEIAKFAKKTKKDISKYRKKFIALLAFTYNEDTNACLDLLGSLSYEESKVLTDIYKNPSSERARFNPSNFIDAVNRFHLTEATKILDSFVDNTDFEIYVRRDALELSENLKPNKNRLIEIVERYNDQDQECSLKLCANSLLITKHNDPDSIKWLVQRIKNSASEHIETVGVHTVGPLEHELNRGEISKPLRELNNKAFIDEFLDLLNFSFAIFKRGEPWHNYTYYIWNIVIGYFEQLKNELKYEPLVKLEQWVSDNSKLDGVNYFKDRLVELRRSYSLVIDRPNNLPAAIKLAEKVHAENGILVTSSEHFKLTIEKIFIEELIPWIETDAHKITNETSAQKLIKVQLESYLLKNGFNPSQLQVCRIIREAQELDDTRTDFLIYHGFIGPVLIELKLFSNSDLKGSDLTSKESYKSLQNYMRQYNTESAILLILDNEIALDRLDLYLKRVDKITNAYTTISGLSVFHARIADRKLKPKRSRRTKVGGVTKI